MFKMTLNMKLGETKLNQNTMNESPNKGKMT